MEAAPDALNPATTETRKGTPAVRAAKDIAFGSVRGYFLLFYTVSNSGCKGCRNCV